MDALLEQTMLAQSFIFLDRISVATERRLWENGINDWKAFRNVQKISGISDQRKKYYEHKLAECEGALCRKDHAMLAKLLPRREHWRLYPLFHDQALFVDIETAERYGDITVLGAWDGTRYYSFVKGCNLEKALVQQLFFQHKLFITFNGSSFDIPIIEKYFGGVLPDGYLHVDLRHVCARLGLHGGLKTIERVLGIDRDEEIEGMVGEQAALLWWEYLLTGDEEMVELLLAYNEADCKNLEPLAAWAIKELWHRIRRASQAPLSISQRR